MQAAPGDLDTTFNGTGKSRVGFGLGDDLAGSVAVQADGKVVVAGSSQNGSRTRYDFSVVRHNADGSLDASFGVGGKVLTRVGLYSFASEVRIQTDGKIVVAGSAANSADFDFAVVRYNTDGSLDTSFGGNGIVITPIGIGRDEGDALIIQPDGKVIVAGHSSFNFAVVRYNANGSLDTTFGSGGKVITDFGNRADANAATIQPDGKIVVAGDFNAPSGSQVVLARYNTNGSPDTTFDGDGIVLTSGSAGSSYGNAVAIQLGTAIIPDKIVVAGYNQSGGYKIAVYRYNLNGSPDTTFNGDGKY